jgi:PhzF family phenazine biosynthesis protein
MEININVVNAFIDGVQGGNPAGVVLDADNLTQQQKMHIAQKVGLSETAFVSSSKVADFKLDFFTPIRQIAHCGHATIAVFSYLAQSGRIKAGWLSKETIDGNRKILIKDDLAYMEQLAPKFENVEQYHSDIFASMNLAKEDVTFTPKLVNTGNSFIVLGVRNAQVLAQLKTNNKLIESLSEQLDLIGFYIFTTETKHPESDVATRMFAPRYGITEEAATGMAAGPLACYLHQQMGINKDTFNIEQGNFMTPPSASLINVSLEIKNGQISSLMAGGTAKLSEKLVVNI